MRHIVLNDAVVKGNSVYIRGKKYHYLKNVRRIKEGDELKSVIGNSVYNLKVEKIGDGVIAFDIINRDFIRRKLVPEIVVFQGILKSKKMDYIVSRLSELGVGAFYPVVMKRSIAGDYIGREKRERWMRLSEEGSKISGIENIMLIKSPDTLKYAVENLKGELIEDTDRGCGSFKKIMFSNNYDCKNNSLKSILMEADFKVDNNTTFILAFGPEGGFDPEEEDFLIDRGFIPASMGDFVMKSETAAVVGTGFVRVFYSDLEEQ